MSRCRAPLCTVILLACTFPAARGDEPEPLKPTNVMLNTDKDEDDPHLSSDGLHLFYSVTTNGKSQILMSTRSGKEKPWPPGKPVLELKEMGDCRSVFLTPEGKYPQQLYVATNYDPEKKDGRGNNFDLYFLLKQGPRAEFTTTTPLHFCTPKNELHPWLLPDGRTLYYSRRDKDGWHIYIVSRPPSGGQFGKPVLVDLDGDFLHPTLTPDGKTMYVEGRLQKGKDRWGLFRTTRTVSGWSKPEPLTALNSAAAETGDHSPCLSRDGVVLYFSSDRPGGKGGRDLWVIPTAQLNKK
jgi:Tol biopolymer transport system component